MLLPVITERSKTLNKEHEQIIDIISSFSSSQYFDSIIGRTQSEQKEIVKKFQNDLCYELSKSIESSIWKTEFKPNPVFKDSIDIYTETKEHIVIIEIDKPRADQVAKKFLSRSALFSDKKIFYISLCYPGTGSMSVPETQKYFYYCKMLSEKLHNSYAGFLIK